MQRSTCVRCRLQIGVLLPASSLSSTSFIPVRNGTTTPTRHQSSIIALNTQSNRKLRYNTPKYYSAAATAGLAAVEEMEGDGTARTSRSVCTEGTMYGVRLKGYQLSEGWFEGNKVPLGTRSGSGDGNRNESVEGKRQDKRSVESNGCVEKNDVEKSGYERDVGDAKQTEQERKLLAREGATLETGVGGPDSADQLPSNPNRNTNHKVEDERTLQLGRTIRTLQSHLPTILQSPLPSEILSPNITLHLFPSTHPHLPTARGKVAYKTALWTSPFVWGQIPGRAKLEVLSEKVIKPLETGEMLIVRWRTISNGSSTSSPAQRNLPDEIPSKDISERYISPEPPLASPSQTTPNPPPNNEFTSIFRSAFPSFLSLSPTTPTSKETKESFTGLFLFTFDPLTGLLHNHTIEHVDQSFHKAYEEGSSGTGAKLIGVTEWLLKKAKEAKEKAKREGVGRGVEGEPGLAWCVEGGENEVKGRGT